MFTPRRTDTTRGASLAALVLAAGIVACGPAGETQGRAESASAAEQQDEQGEQGEQEELVSLEQRSETLSDGREVRVFELISPSGVRVELVELGASISRIQTPDREGVLADVALAHEQVETYADNPGYLGCAVGRVANRIAGARFELDGKSYELAANNGSNHLHGGPGGFCKRQWQGEAVADGSPAVRFSYTSGDGEEGYPGEVSVSVRYTLDTEGALRLDYRASTDAPTPINLTNHSYFNLAGAGSGDVLGHVLELRASRYTPFDATQIPTGELAPVEGTPFDFRTPTAIGARIGELDGGYDHNFAFDGDGGLELVARVHDPGSGRSMHVLSTEPGMQLYTSNHMNGSLRGRGGAYTRHAALCLETQHFPDSINQPQFPSVVLRPGEEFESTTVYRFTTR